MISLCYVLVFMFNKGNVPFVAPNNLPDRYTFKYIRNIKKTISNKELIKGIDQSENLL